MKKGNSIYLFLLLVVSLTSCLNTVKKENRVDLDSVDSVIVYYDTLDNHIMLSKKLSADGIKKFTDDWNKSTPTGLCKYFPFYKITVYQKDKTKRNFRANGKSIKEKTDECFDMGDENYFDKLWEASGKLKNASVNGIEIR